MRGVKGVACVLGTDFISHSLSEDRMEDGDSCMSSTSILWAARSAAVGMRDQMPRRRLRKKMKLSLDISKVFGKGACRWHSGRQLTP